MKTTSYFSNGEQKKSSACGKLVGPLAERLGRAETRTGKEGQVPSLGSRRLAADGKTVGRDSTDAPPTENGPGRHRADVDAPFRPGEELAPMSVDASTRSGPRLSDGSEAAGRHPLGQTISTGRDPTARRPRRCRPDRRAFSRKSVNIGRPRRFASRAGARQGRAVP